MVTCRITFVDFPVIARIAGGGITHEFVAVGLGEDRGRGYVAVFRIAFDHGHVGYVAVWFETVAVNGDSARHNLKRIQGAVHGEDRGVENVDAVYFLMVNRGNGPGYGITFYDGTQFLALLFGEFFRIVEQRVWISVGKNYGSCENGSGQASAPGFIAACFENERSGGGGQWWWKFFHIESMKP